jgi:hypothetical protein
MTLDGLRAWAPRILGGIRLFNGAAALLVPGTVARRLGVDPDANPAPLYPLRMFGVRTVVIGAELLLPQEEEERTLAMRTGILIHASDTLAAGLGGLRGQLPPPTAALLTGVSAVNTALAIVGSSPPRAKPHRRWLRR